MNNEIYLTFAIWLSVSLSSIVAGLGFASLARTLTPYAWPGYVLGIGYLIFGVLASVGLLFTAGGAIFYIRIWFTILMVSQAVLVGYAALRAQWLSQAELKTVIEAVRVFASLKQTVKEVRH